MANPTPFIAAGEIVMLSIRFLSPPKGLAFDSPSPPLASPRGGQKEPKPPPHGTAAAGIAPTRSCHLKSRSSPQYAVPSVPYFSREGASQCQPKSLPVV
ncbi:hypothetical protein CRG98_019813 [Punica granatum]|uniref:Uncharacterized protein n=1 Tax=Punica granatum TaxID=22663 RepID=A0A2I0JU18_PUNGR|nr:hypothetical protein CRG98_019813 [Punica granatum]